MDEELKQLLIRYLKAEEGITHLTDREIEDNAKAGIDVYGCAKRFSIALKQYLGEDICLQDLEDSRSLSAS